MRALPSRLQLPRFTRRITVIAILVVVGLCAIGGGVYAQFGGAGKSNTTASVDLQRGLVAQYKMDGSIKDATPFASNVNASSGLTASVDRKNATNGAVSFNGTSSNARLSDTQGQLQLLLGKVAPTISVWVKTTGTGSQGIIIGRRDLGPVNLWQLNITATGYAQVSLSAAGGVYFSATSQNPVNDNNWHLITAKWQRQAAGNEYLYVDGVLQATTALNGSYTGSNDFTTAGATYISRDSQTAVGYYSGSLDDLRIYNRNLSQAEISALYASYNPTVKAAAGENGLVAWYKLDGSVRDATPYADNASSQTGTSATADREGAVSGAVAFSGTGSAGKLTDTNNTLQLLKAGTIGGTASAWIKTTATSGKIIGRRDANTSWQIYVFGTGTLRASLTSGGTNYDSTSSTIINDNKWHLVTATWTRTGTEQLKTYVDGVLQSTVSLGTAFISTSDLSTSSPVWIGRDGFSDNTSLAGSLDDIRLYTRALSATEIAAQYKAYNPQIELGGSGTAGTVSLSKGLITDLSMNGNLKDATPYAYNGTISGGVTAVVDRKNRAASAYNFNGTDGYVALPSGYSNFANGVSISIWANPASNASYARFVELATGANVNNNIIFSRNSTSTGLFFQINSGTTTSTSPYTTGNGVIINNSWHLYTVTSTAAGLVTIYRDGVAVSGNGATQIVPPSVVRTTNYLGKSNFGDAYYSGQLDDARIWNRVLNQAEVTALYNEYR